MNQTFSFLRFARMHRWLWATKGRTYLIGLGILLVVGWLNLSRVMSNDHTTYSLFTYQGNLSFFILLSAVLVGGLGSDVFSALFRQESAITYLMIPASRSEKFWLGVLYCLAALLVLTILYFGYEAFAFSVANRQLKTGQPHYVSSLQFFTSGNSTIYVLFYTLLLLLAMMVLGSLYFRRGVVARNIGITLLVFIGFFLLYQGIVATQFRGISVGINNPFPFTSAMVHDSHNAQPLEVPSWLTYLAYGVLLVVLWLIARVRFNEIER